MSYLEEIITIISALLILIAYFTKLLSAIKKSRDSKNQNITNTEIMELIQLSELLFDNGENKKTFVMERIKDFVRDNNFNIDLEETDKMIEKYVNLTNKVNINKGENK